MLYHRRLFFSVVVEYKSKLFEFIYNFYPVVLCPYMALSIDYITKNKYHCFVIIYVEFPLIAEV